MCILFFLHPSLFLFSLLLFAFFPSLLTSFLLSCGLFLSLSLSSFPSFRLLLSLPFFFLFFLADVQTSTLFLSSLIPSLFLSSLTLKPPYKFTPLGCYALPSAKNNYLGERHTYTRLPFGTPSHAQSLLSKHISGTSCCCLAFKTRPDFTSPDPLTRTCLVRAN